MVLDWVKLQEYRNWIGKSPKLIHESVEDCGGWMAVFPKTVPIWASRVRNYFNITPGTLMQVNASISRINIQLNNRFKGGKWYQNLLEAHALSGEVYKDNTKRLWFQMHTCGTKYHYSGLIDPSGSFGRLRTANACVSRQSWIPVFKLICPDPTVGGSFEIIIKNPQVNPNRSFDGGPPLVGKRFIGPVGQTINIRRPMIVTDKYKGTYNYAETIIRGLDEHELRDVHSHQNVRGFYIDPPKSKKFKDRKFPEKDQRGKIWTDWN